MTDSSLHLLGNHKKTIPVERSKLTTRVALFTNARDERNIKEWAAHHLGLGFSVIYIFDHKSKYPLQKVFQNFDKRVIVERCLLNVPPKIPLMKRAAKIASSMHVDWFIYLDADEFIILNTPFNIGIKKFLDHYSFADSVAINWLMFGSNNHVKEPSGLILENYTKSEPYLDQHVKSFVRPSQVVRVTNPQFYHVSNPSRMFSVDNTQMSGTLAFHKPGTQRPFQEAIAFIAHYIYQSEETYIKRKIQKPCDDTGALRTRDLEIHKRHNDVDNFIPREKYSLGVKYILDSKQEQPQEQRGVNA